ncbi:MAG TPA: MBL fold metallo-hydrolase [Porphyromonadaceae bacterium]|nr:MBL fold metallo-hydrolase [Porphyromonadaceae bacterium]
MDSIYLLSIGSGSSGNCYYIGTKEWGVLVDLGVSYKNIQHALRNVGFSEKNILAVFITHDHADHCRYAGSVEEKLLVPVYATESTHRGMEERAKKVQQLTFPKHVLPIGDPISINGLSIEAFSVPHDGDGCVGYMLNYGEECVVFTGDLGYISTDVEKNLLQANYLIMETDYDEGMLEIGPYPKLLQERIKSPQGHLCNRIVAEWISSHYTKRLKKVFLSHISANNNSLPLALESVKRALIEKNIALGKDLEVYALQRTKHSELFELK